MCFLNRCFFVLFSGACPNKTTIEVLVDLATVIGGTLGVGLLLVTMMISGSLLMYWDGLSLIIVLGGSALSVLMRWPLNTFIAGAKFGLFAINIQLETPEELIDKVIELANSARKNSIISLEKAVIDNDFLQKGVKLAVDGTDPEMISAILNEEIRNKKKKWADGRGVFDDMGEACPAFGMIGTVVGLIVIMANLSDPSKIGPGLAVALVTTLYGAAIANIIFVPIGKKLKYRGAEEIRNFGIIKTGILAIVQGTNPNLIREQLNSYLDE